MEKRSKIILGSILGGLLLLLGFAGFASAQSAVGPGPTIWRLLGGDISSFPSSAEVGVGSTTPNSKLTVQGTAGSTQDVFSVASSTGASMFKVASNGTVTVPGDFTVSGTCTGCGGAVAGSDTQVIFNDGGSAYGGDAGLVFNKTTNVLTPEKLSSTNATSTYLSITSGLSVGTTTAGSALLHIDGAAATARFRLDADAGVARIFSFASDNLARWALRVDGAESGSEAGGDFSIRRYNDAGTFVDAPFSIDRSSGISTFAGTVALGTNNLTMTGSIAATGARVTKGWFTDIESTNMPTVGGTSLSSTFAPIASPTFTGTVTSPQSNLTQASSTRISVHDKLYAGGTATTTIDSAGVVTFASTYVLDASPNTDHTSSGPTDASFTAAGTHTVMDLLYLNSSSAWAPTDADAAATAGGVLLAFALDSRTVGQTATVAMPGSYIRDDTWNWTPGVPLYVGTTTAGTITSIAPSATDDVIRVVGHAVTADVIFFFPSPDYATAI